jgi:hypothetical protein
MYVVFTIGPITKKNMMDMPHAAVVEQTEAVEQTKPTPRKILIGKGSSTPPKKT